jgi:hypothetical protein
MLSYLMTLIIFAFQTVMKISAICFCLLLFCLTFVFHIHHTSFHINVFQLTTDRFRFLLNNWNILFRRMSIRFDRYLYVILLLYNSSCGPVSSNDLNIILFYNMHVNFIFQTECKKTNWSILFIQRKLVKVFFKVVCSEYKILKSCWVSFF